MSSFRSRSGGSRRHTPLIRKYNSLRNLPASISPSRFREHEEIRRAEVWADLPWLKLSGSIERRARWPGKSSSSMPSRKSVLKGLVPESAGEPSWNCCNSWIGLRVGQFSFFNGKSPRPDSRCKSLAYISFPAPLSPMISTGMSVLATSMTVAFSDCILGPRPKTNPLSVSISMVIVGSLIFSRSEGADRSPIGRGSAPSLEERCNYLTKWKARHVV